MLVKDRSNEKHLIFKIEKHANYLISIYISNQQCFFYLWKFEWIWVMSIGELQNSEGS